MFKPQQGAGCIFNLILSEFAKSCPENPRTFKNVLSNRIYQNQDKKMAEAKAEAPKPAPMIFKGVCKDGVLKGKEIHGKLDCRRSCRNEKIQLPTKVFFSSDFKPIWGAVAVA